MMDETPDSLVMTVHLLANAGHGSVLQQSLDQLLNYIFPEARLFLVSERASPVTSSDRCHPKRSRFPGMSVLLFLHESLGKERVVRVLDSLQRWPWQCYPTQKGQGRPWPCILVNQDFYSLDDQMPIWGVRQVHCGAEILRVTLYCSFDNYEDAIRLYEMILQRDAILQKSNFCVFVLYATESFVLQFSLKQLPLGMSVDPKESTLLQFKVQEIGQLVPLLPHPCIPISSARWQTQDYDGNKILLQVQLSPGPGTRNTELPFRNDASRADTFPWGSWRTPASGGRTQEPRGRRTQSWKFRGVSLELSKSVGSVLPHSLWKSPACSPQASSPGTGAQGSLPSPHLEPGTRVRAFSWDNSSEKLEAETNVDTGFTVVDSGSWHTFPSRFSRGPRAGQPASCLPPSPAGTAVPPNNSGRKGRDPPESRAGQKDLRAWRRISKSPLGLPVPGGEKEEFFI